MGDELADAMGNADLLAASRTSQQRRNTTYPGPDEDLTAWKTQVEIALRGITDPKTKLTLDHLLSSNPRYITVDAVAPEEGGAAAQGGNVLSRDLDGAITPKKLRFATPVSAAPAPATAAEAGGGSSAAAPAPAPAPQTAPVTGQFEDNSSSSSSRCRQQRCGAGCYTPTAPAIRFRCWRPPGAPTRSQSQANCSLARHCVHAECTPGVRG